MSLQQQQDVSHVSTYGTNVFVVVLFFRRACFNNRKTQLTKKQAQNKLKIKISLSNH